MIKTIKRKIRTKSESEVIPVSEKKSNDCKCPPEHLIALNGDFKQCENCKAIHQFVNGVWVKTEKTRKDIGF